MLIVHLPTARALLAGGILFALSGCPGLEDNPCESSSESPRLILGNGVGGAFVAFEDNEDVGLDIAPQGGFGVTTLLRTIGLSASDTALATAQLDVEISGETSGSFLLEDQRLLCRSDGEGGEISGVVVGFDEDDFSSNDALIALNGQIVDLVVSVTDEFGETASTRQPVTVVYGQ